MPIGADNQDLQLIFITGSGRCGTTLMRSLLDNHSKLNVYPREVSRILEKFKAINSNSNAIRIEQIPDSFLQQFAWEGDTGKGYRQINLNIVIESLKKEKKDIFSCEDIFFSVVKNLFPNHKKPLVLDVTSPNIDTYLNYFPECKILHLMRHPFDTLNSFFRFRYNDPNEYGSLKRSWEVGSGFEKIKLSFEQACLQRNNDRVLIVRLEDLQDDTMGAMEKTLKFLGLKVEKENLKISRMGLLSDAGSTVRTASEVFRQERDWSCLTENDLFILGSYWKWVSPWYDLPEKEPSSNKFMPFLGRQMGMKGTMRPRMKMNWKLLLLILPATIRLYLNDNRAKKKILRSIGTPGWSTDKRCG